MTWRPLIGIDENGLGPRMGPLVVTGVRLGLQGPAPAFDAFRRATGLDDSKRIFSPSHRGRGEVKALGVLAAAEKGEFRAETQRLRHGSLAELIAELAVRSPWPPPSTCPDAEAGSYGCCAALSGHGGPIPRWALPGSKNERPVTKDARPLARGLAALGLRVERVASVLLCPGTLNVALADQASKLAVDLRLFEAVATELRRDASGDVELVCGKVGGTDRYAGRFVEWAGRDVHVVLESRARSTYEVAGVGRVSFVRDGDATEPAVAAASVVGKYLRELWMDDLARAAGWAGPAPSGYHDDATARLERLVRARIAAAECRLPAGCVLRAR